MWHQKGEIVGNRIDNIDKGYFLTVEDVPTSAGPGLATKMGFINKDEENTGARGLILAKNYRNRVGEVENNKLVKKEKETLSNISDESIEEIKTEFEMIDDYDDYDRQTETQNTKEDDLLQIPAFLRRQAN